MADKPKKPPTRWGLISASAKKYAKEFLDFDYLEDLTDEELDWLDKFSREYHNNDFTSHEGLTQYREDRKKYHARTNERRRDIWNFFTRLPNDYTSTTAFKDDGGDDE